MTPNEDDQPKRKGKKSRLAKPDMLANEDTIRGRLASSKIKKNGYASFVRRNFSEIAEALVRGKTWPEIAADFCCDGITPLPDTLRITYWRLASDPKKRIKARLSEVNRPSPPAKEVTLPKAAADPADAHSSKSFAKPPRFAPRVR